MSAIYEECDCDVCNVQLNSKTVRFHCADEACNDDWDLCVACFSKGATRADSNHKPWHDYRIIAPVERPLFQADWSGDEELLLLQGSEKFGLGNWSDVAEHVGNRRTKEECDRHYFETYISSPMFPLPDLNATLEYDPEQFQARKRRRIEDRAAIQKLPPPTKSKPLTSTPSCHEVQGYMPGRLEFEHEYENEAEMSVKDLEFDQDLAEGADDEVQLKLTILDIYNSRLSRRADRKRVIFEHNALEYKKNQAIDKKRTKEEKDLVLKTKPFARLLNTQDYETFVDGLIAELSTRRKIAELQEWRRMGLTSMDQGPKYEKDKQHRLLMRSTGPGTTSSLPSSTSLLGRHHASKSSLAGIASGSGGGAGGGSGGNLSSGGGGGDLKKPPLIGLSGAADVQLLSREEQSLCSNLRLLPKAYLVVKETLIRELWRTGGALTKKNARSLLKIDANKTAKVFEYLTQFKLMT